jgi:hypothetical protein
MRDELVQRVAGRLELPERRLEALLAGSGAVNAGSPANGSAPPSPIDQAARAERTFLVLCLALPKEGRAALAAIDPPDEYLTSDPMRRAAHHLAGHLDRPLAELPGDGETPRLIADLVSRAGRYLDPTPDRLEHARLVLELARIERAIRRARGAPGADVTELARHRESVMKALRAVVGRLEMGA